MRYRILSPTGDFVFGAGPNEFLVNSPACVAQAVKTRLALFLGTWFLDTTAGMNWWGGVLGKYTQSTYDMLTRAQILGTQGVTGITSYASAYNPITRQLGITALNITTLYGPATVVGPA